MREIDLKDFPEEEFRMVQFPTFDGRAQYQFEITGRTREHMEGLAEQHGMTLDEWLDYSIRPKPALRLKIKAAIYPRLSRLRARMRRPTA